MRIARLCGLFLMLCGAPALAVEPVEVDPIALAELLLADGLPERALVELEKVDEEDEGLDRGAYFHLLGMARADLGDREGAAQAYQAAVDTGNNEPWLYLRLGQTLLVLERYEESRDTLQAAPDGARAQSVWWMLISRSYRGLGRPAAAYSMLTQGQRALPHDLRFDREALFLLIELGLYIEARAVGRRYLEAHSGEMEAWLGVAEAMRRSGALDEAAHLLEETRMRFPERADPYRQLARVYLDRSMPLSAAEVLQRGVEVDPELALLSAEAYRRAGRHELALYMNHRVADAADKAKQRLGLLIELEDWDRALALEPRLSRLGLLGEDAIAYALAYAWFSVGDVVASERLLKRIDEPKWFRDATALRSAMSRCADSAGGCL